MISLVNPPQLQLWEPYAYPPLGLCYLAAMLNNVRIDNLAGEKRISLEYADVFGITFPSACKESVGDIVAYIRKEYPESKIFLGGPHPTAKPDDVFRDYAPDYVLMGECENLFPYLISHPSFKVIHDGGIIDKLDSLPFPRRDLIDRKVVVNLTGIHGTEKPSTTILSSRGCPYDCRFCCKCHPMYRVFRDRSPEKVVEEIKLLKYDYGVEHLRFIDDAFTLKRSLPKLCELMQKEEVTFICITRADHLNMEMTKSLKSAGCTQVDIGVEYLSDRMLSLMNKQLTVDQIAKSVRTIHDVGIDVKMFLMMRYPGETLEDREKTLKMLSELKPEQFTLSVFQPIEGSALESNSGYFYPDDDVDRQNYQRQIVEAIGN